MCRNRLSKTSQLFAATPSYGTFRGAPRGDRIAADRSASFGFLNAANENKLPSVSRGRSDRIAPSLDTTARNPRGPAISATAEASVRQLIADGDHKTALERAKEIHRASGTVVSEALLVDAYAERIRALIRRNLTVEAKSLIALVRRRYQSARARLDDLMTPTAAQAPSLDALLRPLNDPALGAATRAAIDRTLQRDVWDLAALAGCDALPADHGLRQAAAALERAFVAVTSGPVAEDALRLPEVSHHSPLAPWKLLTRTVASFYRGEDESCQRYIDRIDPESAPARLIPTIQALIAGDAAAPLTPGAAGLRARLSSVSTARSALDALDRAFMSGKKGRILKAIRPVVNQCQQRSPDTLDSLRQHISVRCAMADLDPAKVQVAMGGPSRHDAAFLRLFARGYEETRNPESVVLACSLWEQFRHAAVHEGWFAANGREAAALALHIADLLQQLPDGLLRELQRSARREAKTGREDLSYLFPEEMYQRACALDPHPEAFSQWMDWAARQPGKRADRVATAWHKVRPQDIEPVVRLMHAAEARSSFTSALGYLAKVEQIDRLHPGVRGTRLRLLAGHTLRHLQQKKPQLAAHDVERMSALPEAHHGDRPALLAALDCLVSAARGNGERAATRRADVEELLGSGAAAAMLIFAVATASKQRALGRLGPIAKLPSAERTSLPGALARATALAADIRLTLELPASWMAEVARRFPACSATLETDQLRRLGESALLAGRSALAYAVSAAGLERGGATEGRFLLLRAQSVTGPIGRRVVCARAAAELARQQQDAELVEEAVELVHGLFEFDQVSLTLEQARDVLKREKAAPAPPRRNRPGPAYGDLLGSDCQCATCRQARGEVVGPFDALYDDDLDDFDALYDDEDVGFEIPPDMPPDIAKMFAAEIDKAVRRGESVDEFMAHLFAGESPRRRRKKRKRR